VDDLSSDKKKNNNAKSNELIKLAIVTAPDLEILVNESTLPLNVAHLVILNCGTRCRSLFAITNDSRKEKMHEKIISLYIRAKSPSVKSKFNSEI
jgi:hypothetical protein